VITLDDVSLQIGGDPLLEGASCALHEGWKIGIIGPNGCGKSSLFRLLRGELTPERGRIDLPGGMRIAHMEQETPGRSATAREHVVGGHAELVRLEQELEKAEAAGDGEKLGQLHARIDAEDGYTARTRADQLLAGLGFSAEACGRPVAEFSGGWRMRIDLARTLMAPSDLLLLDEPTNHLDLEAVMWLEQWLKRYSGTLMIISHDRDFLDSVVDHTVHFDQKRLVLYRGNYSQFERQRAERLAQQQAAYEKQQQRVREIEQFVARFRAKATKARQAQSRLKELERMEDLAPAHIDSPFRFQFPEAAKTSHPLITCRSLAAGYDRDTPVLRDVGLSLLPGQRVGLLGVNGAGKSTLIRTLVGELPPLAGERTPGENLAVGYFAQHQVDALTVDWSPLEHLQKESPEVRKQQLRTFLGGFGFPGDDALRPVRNFSGGEKARLALAIVAWRRPNLLLLDEPTNHLDLDMRHALDMALQEFSGAVVIVTHDRHLLRDTVDEFWLIDNGRLRPFDGTLDDYAAWRAGTVKAEKTGAGGKTEAPRPAKKESGRDGRKAAAEARNRIKPLRDSVRRLERDLEKRQQELAKIETALADPDLYNDPARSEERERLMQDQGAAQQAVARLESDWLEAAEELERAEAGTA
jgi:ATP-binding cassette subfamily F protein 3